MPELRQDLVRGNWVLIATDTALKPRDFPMHKNGVKFSSTNNFCPFCEGNEAYTTSELASLRENGSLPDSPGWLIRTITNKYSGFRLEGELRIIEDRIYQSCNGLGQHEVIIETPEHGVEFHHFSREKIGTVLQMLKERYNVLARDERVKYIQIYKNRGLLAGASLEHSHSQILALPMLPNSLRGIGDYYGKNRRCLLCDVLEEEKKEGKRIIKEEENFVVLCPYASRFPYETWIIPRRHNAHFGDISQGELISLSSILFAFLRVMVAYLNDPAYNMVIISAPLNTGDAAGYHWYLEIIPRLLINSGVEITTGIYMNPVAPEIAAHMFRERMSKEPF
ncbi:UDPglucose--hexose-1-phosphate uridylyltransferase [Thermosyntropha lipolytica DSM 11003]|uniref:UDPglucose--hexose-1-phosphate uridylyltransferase n=1 Tax=Thermosyntropha lipolytica DSM 11003 TaxID=1123382 RepID=A0A1M5LPQ8_9FIRM|nr:DUF4931 domain-containing protein [Thermosyntropha lipolytica]SHG67067.1 UDPglucose--hexose-1-phosphate uridylyltransferase [Thermosyntropha lipolytica DSM 11003]